MTPHEKLDAFRYRLSKADMLWIMDWQDWYGELGNPHTPIEKKLFLARYLVRRYNQDHPGNEI